MGEVDKVIEVQREEERMIVKGEVKIKEEEGIRVERIGGINVVIKDVQEENKGLEREKGSI